MEDGRKWVVDGNCAGWLYPDGHFVCECESGTDEQLDKYSIEVQNGEGYYDDSGRFHWFSRDE